MTRGGSTSPAPRGGPSLGSGTDQGAVLRLLGTLREEIESIRTKQAEIYEVILSYKDQLRELQTTVTESLKGLPKSPYIAGQLVPAPRKKQGVDDFRDLLATYLHGPADSAEDEKPVDVDLTPIPIPDLPPVEETAEDADEDEEEEDEERRRRRRGGGGGPRPYDEDVRGLNRGPERDVEPFDLRPPAEDDEEDRGGEPAGERGGERGGERPEGDRGERRGRRRGRRGRRRGRGDDRERAPQDRREGRRDDDDRGGRFERHEHRDSAESSRFAAAVEAGGLSTASSGRLPVASQPPEQPPAEKPAPEPPPSSNPGDEPGV
ncbi:MAG TPA: hypothetical protein VFF73_39275 [Planctomycetota bacterium]|nr:hypothetical protein [Planctomycetota bacterium]